MGNKKNADFICYDYDEEKIGYNQFLWPCEKNWNNENCSILRERFVWLSFELCETKRCHCHHRPISYTLLIWGIKTIGIKNEDLWERFCYIYRPSHILGIVCRIGDCMCIDHGFYWLHGQYTDNKWPLILLSIYSTFSLLNANFWVSSNEKIKKTHSEEKRNKKWWERMRYAKDNLITLSTNNSF